MKIDLSTGKGLSGDVLKYIAIVAMLLDHIATLFVPYNTPLAVVLHFLGRITAPVMFYFVAEGYRNTKNIHRYMLRMLLFTAISYIPYIFAFSGNFPNMNTALDLNVIYTLLCGLIAIHLRHTIQNPVLRWGLIAIMIILAVPGDWSYQGVVYILIFDYFYGDFNRQAVAYVALVLFEISPIITEPVYSLVMRLYEFDAHNYMIWASQLGLFIPILLLKYYNSSKSRSKYSKWGFYIFYPLHLLILGIIAHTIIL